MSVKPAIILDDSLILDLSPPVTPGGGGDITGVAAGDGLTGGGTTGDVALAVDATVVRTSAGVDAGAGLTGGGQFLGTVTLDVGQGDGIQVDADSVSVDGTVVRTTRTITAGAGLTGGGDLSADMTLDVVGGDGIAVDADLIRVKIDTTALAFGVTGKLAVADTAATPGSYTNASLTVDQQGRLTAAASGTTPAVATRQIISGGGLTGGGDLSADRTLAVGAGTGIAVNADDVAIANTAVTPGSYTKTALTVDQQGRITAASSGAADPAGANPSATVSGSAVNGSASTFMRSDGAPALANTAVAAGSYTKTALTVDAQGRLTAASSGAADPTAASLGLDSYAGINAVIQAASAGSKGVLGNQFCQYTPVTVANQANETSLLTGSIAGTATIVSADNAAGASWEFQAWGVHSTDSTVGNTAAVLRLKLGSTTILANASSNFGANRSGRQWYCRCLITQVDASTVLAQGFLDLWGNATTNNPLEMNGGATAISVTLTGNPAWDFTMDWGTGLTANSWTITNATMDRKR